MKNKKQKKQNNEFNNVFLLGDFNLELLKYDKHAGKMNFLTHFLRICFCHISSIQIE